MTTSIHKGTQVATRSSNGGGGAALRSAMTVGRLTLREERSRTVKASERVAQDIASGDADASQAMMAEHVERQHEYLRTRSPARIEEYIQWR